jgi:hypothetical protein
MGLFKVTVTDDKGNPVPDMWVVANDLITGQSYSRSTDGGGYADVNTGTSAEGNRVTLVVTDPKIRYVGNVWGDAYEVRGEQEVNVVVTPFV